MITHEQATVLRAIKLGFAVTPPNDAKTFLKPFIAAGSFIYWRLNDEGEAALAEYEAAHVTLTKDQLGEVFKAGYEDGLDDGMGGPYEANERWRLSNIWDNLQVEKA